MSEQTPPEGATTKRDAAAIDPDRDAMDGGDRERGDRGPAADEAGTRSHGLSTGTYGATEDYGDG